MCFWLLKPKLLKEILIIYTNSNDNDWKDIL